MASKAKVYIRRRERNLARLSSVVERLLESRQSPQDWLTPSDLDDAEGLRTPWRLAESFLIARLEFSEAIEGWRRFHGANTVPNAWVRTADTTGGVTDALMSDENFLRALTKRFSESDEEIWSLFPTTSEEICLVVIDAEKAAILGNSFLSHEAVALDSFGRSLGRLYRQRAFNLAGGIQQISDRNSSILHAGLWHARKRRNATLRARNLIGHLPDEDLNILYQTEDMKPQDWIQGTVENLQLADDTVGADAVTDVLDQTSSIIQDMGYDEFYGEVQTEGFAPDWGETMVNIIPGTLRTTCKPILIAFANGGTGKNSLSQTLTKVNDHLIECFSVKGGTRVVILYTNFWCATKFGKEHASTFSAWARQGVRFLFIGIGHPDREMAPLSIALP